MADTFRYAAFISYSHKDERFAAWLHRRLESYRMPKEVARSSRLGVDRLSPVFRDHEELAATTDLTENIRAALRSSRTLIVICSAPGRDSQWVNREIEYFSSLGRADCIFGIVPDTEPSTSPATELFPRALSEVVQESFVPDARGGSKNKTTALFKLLAGLHGVALGQVIERDAIRRRMARLRVATVASVAVAIGAILLSGWWVESRRASAEFRNRLLTQAHSAFEDGQPERGVTLLTSGWGQLNPEDQKRHAPVLEAWSHALPNVIDEISKLPANSSFTAGGSVYLFDGANVRRSPFASKTLVVADPDGGGVFAMDLAARMYRWSPSAGAPIQLFEPTVTWEGTSWREAAYLKGGTLLLAGQLDSSAMSEQLPVLLVVRPEARTADTIFADDDFHPYPAGSLLIAPDCKTLGWRSASVEADKWGNWYQPAYFGSKGDTRYLLDLEQPASRPRVASEESTADFRLVEARHETDVLRDLLSKCDIHSYSYANSAAQPELNAPIESQTGLLAASSTAMQSLQDSLLSEAAVRRATFVTMADHIQRMPQPITFPGAWVGFDQTDQYDVIATNIGTRTLAGYDAMEHLGLCRSAHDPGRSICVNIDQRRFLGSPRVYPRFVYVPGGFAPDDPFFLLLRLSDLKVVRIGDAGFAGATGVDGRSTALSPSGTLLAVVSQGRVYVFEIDAQQNASLRNQFDVGSLIPSTNQQSASNEPAVVDFVNDRSLVIARSDGLLLKLDAATGQEAWRLRVPGFDQHGKQSSALELAIAPDRSLIVLRSGEFGVAIDANAGLMLRHSIRLPFGSDSRRRYDPWQSDCWDMLGRCYSTTGAASVASGPSIVECQKPGLHRCFGEDEIGKMFDQDVVVSGGKLLRLDDPRLAGLFAGKAIQGSNSPRIGEVAFAPAADISCRTGFRVEGDRLLPYDPVGRVPRDGTPTSIEALRRACG